MHPILFRIPWTDADVSTWGVCLVVALVVGIGVAAAMAARDGVEPSKTLRAGVAAVAASLVGVVAMGLVDGSGGRVLYGGIVAGTVATALVGRSSSIGWRTAVDAGAVGLAFGIAVGRLGCFAAGCCAGTVCSMPWGVTYPLDVAATSGPTFLLPRHPVQLYEAALALAIGVCLVRLYGRRSFRGQVALAFLVLYPLARFVVEFWRGDDRGDLLGLTRATDLSPAQIVSLAILALTIPAAAIALRRTREAAPSDDSPETACAPPHRAGGLW